MKQNLPSIRLPRAAWFAGLTAFVFLLPAAALAEDTGKPVRIAVIWSADLENHGVLMETALSGEESIAVVDRSRLADIAQEFELGLAGLTAGGLDQFRLLNADGILFLETIRPSPDGSARLAIRLASVETGAVVAAYVTPEGHAIKATPDTAAVIARRFLAPARNLGGKESADSVPISILNIRPSGVTPSPQLLSRQREISALLGPRLTAEPEVFILERRRLGDLDFEKVFAGEASRAFWTGARLLDGEVKEEEGVLFLSVRLTDPSGKRKQEITYLLEGADGSVTAVEKIAKWAGDAVRNPETSGKKSSPAGRWDRNAEANAFRQEALWANSNAMYEESAEAARAAWILGGTFKTSAFRTLVVAETGLAGRLVYRPRREEGKMPDYLTQVRHATVLVWDMKNLLESSEEKRNAMGILVNGSEAARQVLFACWRENAFRDALVAAELSQLRTAFRAFLGPMDDAIAEYPAELRRMSAPVKQWRAQKAMMLGLLFEEPDQAFDRWHVELGADSNLAPDPVWMRNQLAPAATDWSSPFHRTSVLNDWKILAGQLDQSSEPHQRMKGWILRLRLWQDWQAGKKRNPEAYGDAEELPVYSWFARTDPAEVFAILRAHRERFVADSHHLDYYLVPLFEAARRLPRTDQDGWATEDGPFFSSFCQDLLENSKTVQPMLTEFLFSIRGSQRRLPNSGVTGFRFPREEWVSLAKTFETYEKRILESLDPATARYAFFKERDVIDRESLLDPPNERENNPLAVLTLTDPIRTGREPPTVRSNPFYVHGRLLPGGVAHSVRVGFTHDVLQPASAGQNAISTYRLTELAVERLDLATAKMTSTPFPIPEELTGRSRRISTFAAHRSYATADETLVTGKIIWEGGKDAGLCLLALNHASGESRLFDLGPFDANPNVTVSQDGVAYFRHAGNIVAGLRSGGSGGQFFQGTGFKMFLALQTYDTRNGQFRVLVNTSRRPAENFLDDRQVFGPFQFGPGPGGRPLLKGHFNMTTPAAKSRRTPSTLVWNEESSRWLPNDFCLLKDNNWYGWNEQTSGFVTTRTPSGEYLISKEGKQAPLLGRYDSFPFLLATSVYSGHPIASFKSTQNAIESGGVAMLPDGSIYFLLVRKDRQNREVPLLRCWHPKFGRPHYDLLLDLQNRPSVDQSYYLERSRRDPDNFPYRWKLVVAGDHLALMFSNRVQANYYLLRKEAIEEKLRGLHAARESLTRFETFTDADLEAAVRVWRREESVVKAILNEDTTALGKFLDAGMPLTIKLGQEYLHPLHFAALAGKPKSVALFLDCGADVNALSSEVPAYVFAIRSENLDCIRQLLKAKDVRIDQSIHAHSLPILHEALQTRNHAVFDLVWEHLGQNDLKKTLETIETVSRHEGKLSIYEETRERLAELNP